MVKAVLIVSGLIIAHNLSVRTIFYEVFFEWFFSCTVYFCLFDIGALTDTNICRYLNDTFAGQKSDTL